jgi:hypothetical protein
MAQAIAFRAEALRFSVLLGLRFGFAACFGRGFATRFGFGFGTTTLAKLNFIRSPLGQGWQPRSRQADGAPARA